MAEHPATITWRGLELSYSQDNNFIYYGSGHWKAWAAREDRNISRVWYAAWTPSNQFFTRRGESSDWNLSTEGAVLKALDECLYAVKSDVPVQLTFMQDVLDKATRAAQAILEAQCDVNSRIT